MPDAAAGVATSAAAAPGDAAGAAQETATAPEAENSCAAVGSWWRPGDGATPAHDALIAAMAERPVVLLGERHDRAEHHRWQLATLAALHGRAPHLVLGFEAFPRRVQPALDRWVAGELDRDAFLRAVDWPRVWGIDPELYLPLFHFARQHRIPMVALNVERALVARVGREGFAAVPADAREGIGEPAPASAGYRDSLAATYGQHRAGAPDDAPADPNAHADPAALQQDPAFVRFVEAQLTWDRAMAEALAAARGRPGQPLVVGIIGSGHLERGHGVPHQLRALGIADAAVLLPHEVTLPCAELPADIADALFMLDPVAEPAPPDGPRLGVMIESGAEGVEVREVSAASVAAAADLRAGDLLLEAAGKKLGSSDDLIEIVQRQAPGTWLPLKVARGGATSELIAKFPPAADESE